MLNTQATPRNETPSGTASTTWSLPRDCAQRYERVLVPAILGPAARALVDARTIPANATVCKRLEAWSESGGARFPFATHLLYATV